MRNIAITAFFMLCTIVPQSFAQETEKDPLQGDYRIADAADLLTLWAGDLGTGMNQINHKFHSFLNLNNPDPNVLDQLQPGNKMTETGEFGTNGDRPLDMIVGDFNGDNVDDIVAAWEGPNRTIAMVVPAINKGSLDWSNSNFMTVSGAILLENPPASAVKRQLVLASGFFDDDVQEEFLLAYWAEDGTVQLRVFDTNGTLSPQQISSATTVTLPTTGGSMTTRSGQFDVTTGDLDGDGGDEIIVIAGLDLDCSQSQGCWQVAIRVYDFDATTRQITELPIPADQSKLWEKTDNSSRWIGRLTVRTGDLENDGIDEIVVGFERSYNTAPDGEWFIRTLKMTPALNGFDAAVGEEERIDQTNGSNGYPLSIAIGDMDSNGDQEIVYAGRRLFVFDADSALQLNPIAGGSLGTMPGGDSHRMIVLADLDADNDIANGSAAWSPEIVAIINQDFSNDGGIGVDGRFHYAVWGFTPGQFNLELRAELNDEESDLSGVRPLAMVAGNFGGNGLRVGSPQRYTRTDIVEPLVILNAPPTHFDVLGSESFDITECYNDNSCFFSATYETETQQTISMETQFNRDWSVGVRVDGGFTIPIIDVGVKVHLETKYGEGFSKRKGSRETLTVSQSIDAIADDWIYAVIVDYDIWEYPLLYNGDLEGYIAVVVPKSRERAWFDSKSFSAFTYIPSHEVGNILSYPEISSPEQNSALDVAVRWNTGDRITLNNNSSATWTLTSENETETSTENSDFKSIGGSVDFNIPFKFIPDVGIDGDYSESNVSTYTSRVTDRKGLSVHFEAIDLSVGNTRYAVTPYAYWAKNGALVLDYAVKPELPPNPIDPATWWSTNYGQKPDPTFILPWRNDPEKGLGLAEEAQRYRTRDIIFAPTEPKIGDLVTIKARIQNYSLLPTNGPVKVQFYLGDPDAGGTRLVSSSGANEVFTDTGIIARGNGVVEFQWTVPSDIPRFSRIYAVVDPDNVSDEIHENNNKAWGVLFVENGVVSVSAEETSALPAEFALQQNYPNPFNPATTITFALPKDSRVKLTVFDLLGREVAVLVDRVKPAGVHTAEFNAAILPSGVYYYRVEAGEFTVTKKMLLVK
jgi:hypothetical protein